jgi:hypothetical protein
VGDSASVGLRFNANIPSIEVIEETEKSTPTAAPTGSPAIPRVPTYKTSVYTFPYVDPAT